LTISTWAFPVRVLTVTGERPDRHQRPAGRDHGICLRSRALTSCPSLGTGRRARATVSRVSLTRTSRA
jgi:hypothetical protein